MMCEPVTTSTNLGGGDGEDPYPSLSDFHDYEPNLEFDDTELEQVASTTGKIIKETKTKAHWSDETNNLFIAIVNSNCSFII